MLLTLHFKQQCYLSNTLLFMPTIRYDCNKVWRERVLITTTR